MNLQSGTVCERVMGTGGRSPYAQERPVSHRAHACGLTELIRRAAECTLPHYEVVRAKMILFAAEGLDNDAIAKRLDTCREIVSRWRKRFFEQRLTGLTFRTSRT